MIREQPTPVAMSTREDFNYYFELDTSIIYYAIGIALFIAFIGSWLLCSLPFMLAAIVKFNEVSLYLS